MVQDWPQKWIFRGFLRSGWHQEKGLHCDGSVPVLCRHTCFLTPQKQ